MKRVAISGIGYFLASCASVPIQDKVERPVSRQDQPEEVIGTKRSAGRVTFASLSPDELASIRVIPESGNHLFQPENKSYLQVDGFWWRGEPDRWFKIPDLSEVWVGEVPENYDGESHLGSLRIYHATPSFLRMIDRESGRALRPVWVPDADQTKSPVSRPSSF